jgi:hypothetical protein
VQRTTCKTQNRPCVEPPTTTLTPFQKRRHSRLNTQGTFIDLSVVIPEAEPALPSPDFLLRQCECRNRVPALQKVSVCAAASTRRTMCRNLLHRHSARRSGSTGLPSVFLLLTEPIRNSVREFGYCRPDKPESRCQADKFVRHSLQRDAEILVHRRRGR